MSDGTSTVRRRNGRPAQPQAAAHDDAHAGSPLPQETETSLARYSAADLTFDEEHHTYWLGPIRVPNVTEIISPLVDLSKAPAFMVEYKKMLGTAVHKACELYDMGVLDETQLDERIIPYLEGWKQFHFDYKPEFIAIEERVLSLDPLYAGTLDRVAVIDDTLTTIDIKTSARLYPSVAIQLTAYQYAQNGATDSLWAVQLKPNGTYHIERYDSNATALMDVFRACLAVHNWKEQSR